jgi:hypothetical protein
MWPKLASWGVAELLLKLHASDKKRLAAAQVRGGASTLGYRKAPLYVLSVYRTEPPCWNGDDQLIAQRQGGWLNFSNDTTRDAAFLCSVGKLMFLWWTVWGDDFHLTSGLLGSFPAGLDQMPEGVAAELCSLASRLDVEMQKHIDVTPYAGMRIGNYRLDEVRDLTDEGDALIGHWLGIDEYMGAVELAFQQFAKKTGERAGVVSHEQ